MNSDNIANTNTMTDIERVKNAYIKSSKVITDLQIIDIAQCLDIYLETDEISDLEQWAIVYKIDQTINNLIELRQQIIVSLEQVAKIKNELQQIKQITFIDSMCAQQGDPFFIPPPPIALLKKRAPHHKDTKK